MSRSLLCLILFLFSVSALWAHSDEASGLVRVGIFPFEPINFTDNLGAAKGLYPDLIRQMVSEEDWTVEFVPGTWSQGLERLQSGEIDLMTTIAYTDERAQVMDFNREAVVNIWGQVFLRPDSKINTIADLEGRKVAITERDISGINFIKIIKDFGVNCTIVTYLNHEDVFRALQAQEVAAAVAPSHFGVRHADDYGLVPSSIQFSPFSVYFASKKGHFSHLLQHIDQHLSNWKADKKSFYYQRLNHWLVGREVEKEVIPLWLLISLGVILSIALALLCISLAFKSQVRRATVEVRTREQEYRNLLEGINSIVLRVDTNGTITFINNYGLEFFGYKREELVGRSVLETIVPAKESGGRELEPLIRAIFSKSAEYETVENENVCKDGRRVYIQWRNRPEYDESGRQIGALSVGADITERQKAEEALRESEEMMRSSQSVAHICSYSTNLNINNIEQSSWVCSPEFYNIFGIDETYPHTIAGWANFIHPDHREDVFAYHESVVKEKKSFSHEYKIIRINDGTERWVHGTGELDFDEKGNPVRMHGAIQDITERQKAAEILRSKEEKFRTLFEHVTDYALVLKPQADELIIYDLSESACNIHGYTREELLGKPITFLDINEAPADDWRMQKIRAGETVQFEVTHRRKDGSTLIVEAVVRMIVIDGEPLVFSIERDLTQKKQVEAERAELEKSLHQKFKMEAIGTLAGGIAHDFNNILAIIIGSAEMLKRKVEDDENSRGKVTQILKASGRAKNLVDQVLAFSRQQEQSLRPTLVVALIEETIDLLLATIPRTVKISSNFAEGSDSFRVKADPVQFQQVLINLCNNAVYAMEEKGVITLELSRALDSLPELTGRTNSAGYLQLTVNDTGEGIAADKIEKIFDPFYTTKDVGKGTGMGLAVVHGIIQSHNGLIQVESSLGEGSRFQILLPLTDDEVFEESVEEEPLPTGTEKILVVDDEEDLTLWVEELLVQQGFRPVCFADSQAALEHFNANPEAYDLLVTDQSMPGLSGVELIEQIRHLAPQLPVVLCSGYSTRISEEILLKLNISEFLSKPYRGVWLLNKIRCCLDKKTLL